MFPIGLLGLAGYVVGLPLLVFVTLARYRASLFTDPRVFSLYGTLYRLVRRPYFYLPIALMARKLAIVAISLFFSLEPALLVALLLAINVGSSLVLSRVRPYYFSIYDSLDTALTGVISALLLCGMVLYSESDASASSALARAMLVLVFATLIVLAFVVVAFVVREIWRERTKGQGTMHTEAFESRARSQLSLVLLDVDSPVAFLSSVDNVTRSARATPIDGTLDSDTFGAEVELTSIVDGVKPLHDLTTRPAA